MTRRCPECARPLEYGDDIVAARIGGLMRELHRECLPGRGAGEDEPATVGGRMAAILEVDDEAGTRPAVQESAVDGAEEGDQRGRQEQPQ